MLTGGAHTRRDPAVEGGPAFVRDRVPGGWIVAAADRPYTRTAPSETEENYIEFRGAVEDGTPDYIARAPSGVDGTGLYTFGSVEGRCSNKDRPAGPFLPADRPDLAD